LQDVLEAAIATNRSRDATRRNKRPGQKEDQRGNNPKEKVVVKKIHIFQEDANLSNPKLHSWLTMKDRNIRKGVETYCRQTRAGWGIGWFFQKTTDW
jgi:hypothetical protein